MKRHFVFNTEWYEIIRDCSTIIKGEVLTAVMEYATTGQEIAISDEATVIFKFIKREIDRREKRRKATEARRQNKALKPTATEHQKPDTAAISDIGQHGAGLYVKTSPQPDKKTPLPAKPRPDTKHIKDNKSQSPAYGKIHRQKVIAPEKKTAIGQLMTVLSNLASDRE